MPGCTRSSGDTILRPTRALAAAVLLYVSTAPAQDRNAPAVDRPIEEVVVVGSKTARPLDAVPGQVSTLDAERLALEQVQAFGDIARYEPAIEADFGSPRFGASGIAVRGIGGNRVALEFDGVPLPQRYAVGNFADSSRLAVDPAIVERIEILRGPASALYGSDAIGGVVAITSIDGDRLVRPGRRVHVGTRAGWYGQNEAWAGGVTVAGTAGGGSGVASLGRRRGHAPDNAARGVPDDRIHFDQWQGFAKWTHALAPGLSLRLSLDHYRRDTQSDIRSLPGYGRFANTTSLRGDDEQRRDRVTLRLALDSGGWADELSVMLYRQSNHTEQHTRERRTSRGVPVRLARAFSIRELGYGGELRGRWNFDTGPVSHVLVAGAEWDHQRLTEARDGTQTDVLAGTSTRSILGEMFPLRDMPKSVADEIGVYAQDELEIGPVILTAALRWDTFILDARTDAVFSDPTRLTDIETDKATARLGIVLRATDALSLYAHYAQGFRAPPPGDVNLFLDIALFNFRALPNPDLEPERSDGFEVGLRLRRPGTALEAAAYYTAYEDFIESRANLGFDPALGALIFQSRNLREAHIYGVEASVRQDLGALLAPLAAFALEAGFHWARGENDETNAPLNEVNPLKATFALRWANEGRRLDAALRATYLARQSRVDFSAGTFFVPPSAAVLDATLRWRPRPRVEAQFGVYNLADRRYWRYADVRRLSPGDPRVEIATRPGRHARVTLSLRF